MTRHVQLAPEVVPVTRRFQHIHVDLVGPLPPSNGFTHLFTIVDRGTRWFEAIPIASTTAADCANALFAGWITRFRVPEHITSDRGAQFTAALWTNICKKLNIVAHQTTAFHPCANGMVERVHRRLKEALKARLAGIRWAEELPWVLLGIRSQPREDSARLAAEAVCGQPLVLPGQFLHQEEAPVETFFDELRMAMSGFEPQQPRHNISREERKMEELPADLLQAEFVLVRRDGQAPPLVPRYDGPYRVMQRSLRHFKIQMGSREETVSTSRLKAAYMPEGARAAMPPKRGRPIKKRDQITEDRAAVVKLKKRVQFACKVEIIQ